MSFEILNRVNWPVIRLGNHHVASKNLHEWSHKTFAVCQDAL